MFSGIFFSEMQPNTVKYFTENYFPFPEIILRKLFCIFSGSSSYDNHRIDADFQVSLSLSLTHFATASTRSLPQNFDLCGFWICLCGSARHLFDSMPH
jgi:hypothetical protein